ncbi:uncharacterized protein AKAW2_11961A [Aspergillus luchuensis]|uniref:Uncharacterized protein n=1 Tax=Aspergillus kawachii TaxID=1069201 RepID=A0A7R7W226_ASPKA|nr:uncharacterized protein AKAW2_11961A [Aspergillus luchuensis]BCR94915.1 hypothetical protein AKAW2_11961A [Aspergillus luchuensis]BCS07490.1 hypothetical protein ALUC_11871A [Aspergillus luchuensis]
MGSLPRSNKGARANNTSFGLGSVCSHQPFLAWTFVHVPAASVHHTPASPQFPFLPFSFRFIMLECPIFPACYAYFSVRSLVLLSEEDNHHAKRRALGADQAWIRHDPF